MADTKFPAAAASRPSTARVAAERAAAGGPTDQPTTPKSTSRPNKRVKPSAASSSSSSAADAGGSDGDDEPNPDDNYFGVATGMAPTPVRMYHALGETFKVPKVVKPMAQHGNVVLNSEVHLNLREHREKLRAINRQKLNQLPDYPPQMTPATGMPSR